MDTEFTSLIEPQLLSIGAVTLDGREHYVELDMSTDIGQARLKASSDFVRYDGVLDMFGLVPGASATYWEMGRRTGEWLLGLAEEFGRRVEVAFDYATDYELMEYAIRDSGLWDQVREIVLPADIGPLTGRPEGEDAADECFRAMHARGLARHHALADANALKAACSAVNAAVRQMADGKTRRGSEKSATTRVLFCDIDGVLHNTALIENVDLAGLAAQGAEKLLAIGLFGLAQHLEKVLVDPRADDVMIAVHSSWRGTLWAPPMMRQLLNPLGVRFQGMTSAKLPREQSIRDLCSRIEVDDHLIIDDAGHEFREQSRLIVTNPLRGVSDPEVLARVREWAAGGRT